MTNPDSLADSLVDRRSLRRKLSFWRILAFIALIAFVLAAGWRAATSGNRGLPFQNQIARISIGGLITGDRGTLRLIRQVERDKAVKGVLLSIASPGGTTSGAERLYDALRELAAKKPVVADVQDMAASGAYIAALGADHIVAQGNSLVGSIGVLIEFPNFSKLLNTVGVSMDEIKSSPLKAAPDGLTPTSPEAAAAMQALVVNSYAWFKNLVQTRRHMTDAELAAVDDGRVFTGRQGLPLKLIDQVGEESDAIAWLEKQKNVPKGLPVRDWRPPQSSEFGLFGAAANLASFFGLDAFASGLRRAELVREASVLDGLTSIWQASPAN
jgi:protease IV